MKRVLSCIVLLLCMVPAVTRAASPRELTLAAAESLAVAEGRAERRAAASRVASARAESLAVRAAPPIEWSVMHARAGERFAGNESQAWEVEAAREFDVWGRRARATRAAGLVRSAATLDAAALDARLRLEARAAFRSAAFAERRLARLDELADGERALADRVMQRVREGSRTPLEGRLALLERAGAEARVAEAHAACEAARLELGRVLGVDDPAWALAVPLAERGAIDTLASRAALTRAVAHRADLAQARAQVQAGAARERWAALADRPDLTLSLAATFDRAQSDVHVFRGDPGGLTGLREDDRGLALRIRAPMPDPLGARAIRASAAAARAQAESELAQLERVSAAEAEATWAAHRRAARLAAEWRALAAQAEQDLQRVREAYADGRLPHAEYLALRRQLVDAVVEGLEHEAEHWRAVAALERAGGMGIDAMHEEAR